MFLVGFPLGFINVDLPSIFVGFSSVASFSSFPLGVKPVGDAEVLFLRFFLSWSHFLVDGEVCFDLALPNESFEDDAESEALIGGDVAFVPGWFPEPEAAFESNRGRFPEPVLEVG